MSMVCFAEALVMDDLPGPKELDGIPDIWVVGETKDVVVSHPRLLFRTQVFVQVGQGVPGNGKSVGVEGST